MARKSYWDVVLENQGLVGSIVKREYMWAVNRSPIIEWSDLFQVGLLGLHRAVQTYDKKTGYKLTTYAYYWIKQHITRCIQSEVFGAVRVPSYQFDRLNKIKKKFGEDFDLSDLFLKKKISLLDYRAIRAIRYDSDIRLDEQVNPESASLRYADFILVHEGRDVYQELEHGDMQVMVERACEKLSPKELLVLQKRYGLNGFKEQTLEEIGKDIKLTRERVRQIEVKTIERLKRLFRYQTVPFDTFPQRKKKNVRRNGFKDTASA